MKAILFAAGLLLSQAALSFDAGTYQGGGQWKEPSGDKGTWTETTQIKAVQGGLEITSNLKVLKGKTVVHEENGTITIAMKSEGFFDVVKEGNVVGHGYCFEKTCHYDFSDANETGEETIHMWKDAAYKIGSAHGEQNGTKWSVAWKGGLKKVK